jgi:hypothetical protein
VRTVRRVAPFSHTAFLKRFTSQQRSLAPRNKQNDTQDPHPLPPRAPDESLLQAAITQAKWLSQNAVFAKDTCALCNAALQIGKFLSLAAPEQASAYILFLCELFEITGNCPSVYGPTTFGPVLAQVLANADVVGYDGQVCRLPSRGKESFPLLCLFGGLEGGVRTATILPYCDRDLTEMIAFGSCCCAWRPAFSPVLL